MKYYLELTDKIVNNSKDLFDNRYEICDISFGTLYMNQGYIILNKILQENEEKYADQIKIISEENEEISFDKFSELIEENTVIMN